MMSPLIGEVRAFSFMVNPKGWLVCNGLLYPIKDSAYQGLFAIISNRFGGDGKEHFAVPNFRRRAPLGVGEGSGLTPRTLADRPGVATVLASAEYYPPHTHTVCASAANATTGSGLSATLAKAGVDAGGGGKLKERSIYAAAEGNVVNMGADALSKTSSTNTAHNNLQPYLPFYFYICYSGVYPPRPD